MYLLEDEAASRPEGFHLLAHVPLDFLRRAVGEHMARIAATTPEGEVPAKIRFQSSGVHPLAGDLHGINGVQTGIDQVWEKSPDAPAAMQHDFHIGKLFRAAPHLLMAWFE